MKMYVYITDMKAFLNGDYNWSLNISSSESMGDANWIMLDTVDVNVVTDNEAIRIKAVECIDKQMELLKQTTIESLAKMQSQRDELMAITFDGDSDA